MGTATDSTNIFFTKNFWGAEFRGCPAYLGAISPFQHEILTRGWAKKGLTLLVERLTVWQASITPSLRPHGLAAGGMLLYNISIV